MSYILDALKKADAERERGAVPGLRAQPVVSDAPSSAPSTRRMRWALAGVASVAALAGAYWLGAGSETASPPATERAAAASAIPKAAMMPPPVPTPPPAAPTVTTVATAPMAPAPSPKPAATPTTRGISKSPSSATPAAPPTPVTAAPAPLLTELPADVRSQIPAITIQGSIYSETPSQRLLLANGQVLNQGATLAPDLTVVEIGKGQSEFSFRGTRFRIGH